MGLIRLEKASQTVPVLGDDEEVDRGLRADVPESKRLIIFINDVGRDLDMSSEGREGGGGEGRGGQDVTGAWGLMSLKASAWSSS